MTPEGNSSKTWVIILIIAVILAIAGFWYYSSGQDGAQPNETEDSLLNESSNTNEDGSVDTTGSGGTGANVDGNVSGGVNFGTTDDLPAGSTYPDTGK
mgnify:CR=1 FL=1